MENRSQHRRTGPICIGERVRRGVQIQSEIYCTSMGERVRRGVRGGPPRAPPPRSARAPAPRPPRRAPRPPQPPPASPGQRPPRCAPRAPRACEPSERRRRAGAPARGRRGTRPPALRLGMAGGGRGGALPLAVVAGGKVHADVAERRVHGEQRRLGQRVGLGAARQKAGAHEVAGARGAVRRMRRVQARGGRAGRERLARGRGAWHERRRGGLALSSDRPVAVEPPDARGKCPYRWGAARWAGGAGRPAAGILRCPALRATRQEKRKNEQRCCSPTNPFTKDQRCFSGVSLQPTRAMSREASVSPARAAPFGLPAHDPRSAGNPAHGAS
jgi:hypothetical protein